MILKRFSQEVDLTNGSKASNFLVFDHNGREIRLPVPQETIEALIQEMHGNPEAAPARVEPSLEEEEPSDESEHPEGATHFGGDDDAYRAARPPLIEDRYEDAADDVDAVDEVPSL